jgi:hypothetical protein
MDSKLVTLRAGSVFKMSIVLGYFYEGFPQPHLTICAFASSHCEYINLLCVGATPRNDTADAGDASLRVRSLG